jgi:hypothetical protein
MQGMQGLGPLGLEERRKKEEGLEEKERKAV